MAHDGHNSAGDSFWRDKRESCQWGWIHRSNAQSSTHWPETAVVFVHGVMSSPALWGNIAKEVLKEANIDVDAFAFGYMCYPGIKGSNRENVESLRESLTQCFVGNTPYRRNLPFRNLLFVCHSNGGIVTKSLLLDSALRTKKGKREDIDKLLDRTLAIVNVAVPHGSAHLGISIPLYLGTAMNICLFPLLWPMGLALNNWLGMRGRPLLYTLGVNTVFWSISWPGRKIRKLESSYQKEWRTAHPGCEDVDFVAKQDIAAAGIKPIPETDRSSEPEDQSDFAEVAEPSKRTAIALTGPHFLEAIDKPRLKSLIAEKFVKLQRSSMLATLARLITMLIQGVEDACDVRGMISGSDGRPQQKEVFEELCGEIAKEHDRLRIYIYGPAGVGKSRLLARLCKHYMQPLETSAGDAPKLVPLLLQAQDLTLSPEDRKWFQQNPATGKYADEILSCRAERLQKCFLRDWSEFLSTATSLPSNVINYWLVHIIKNEPCLCLIDGIDDFLSRTPEVTWDDFLHLIEGVEKWQDQGPLKRHCIIGMRMGFLGLNDLEKRAWKKTELFTLDLETASKLVPAIEPLFEEIKRKPQIQVRTDARELLGSPLVLFRLGPGAKKLADQQEITVAKILDEALHVILRATPSEVCKDQDVQFLALVLLGGVFYAGQSSDQDSQYQTERTMADEIAKLHRVWTPFLVKGSPLARAFEMCAEPKFIHDLMKTIFVARGLDQHGELLYTFQHRHWRTFLVSQYFARCGLLGVLPELGKLAFLPDVTTLAGEHVGPWQVPADIIRQCLDATIKHKNIFYIGNLSALHAWNPHSQLDGDALQAFLATLAAVEVSPVAKCFVMNAICLRVLRDHCLGKSDVDSIMLNQIKGSLEEAVKNPTCDPLTRSQAWCYLTAFEPSSIERLPDWTSFGLASTATLYAADLITLGALQNQSLQLSFVQLVKLLDKDFPIRLIPTAHYVYFLQALASLGRWISESNQLLKQIDKLTVSHNGNSVELRKLVDGELETDHSSLPDWCKGAAFAYAKIVRTSAS